MTNYADLRTLGLQSLERMNGGTWTDFNAHDPGITLLEALCYALTDLDYRTNHDVVDLLADGNSDPHESLHHPADLLTTRAVTDNDLRRIVLDVPGVKNAWIETVEERVDDTKDSLVGIYRIVVEASPEREGRLVQREVGRRIYKHRGLCQDFADIIILEPLGFAVDANIEIGRVDDPPATYGAILEAISEIISPTIAISSLAERFASGLPIDEIFDGPLLENGFITDAAMSRPRHRALHTSDIVHAIMDVPGVRAVTEITLRAGDQRDSWSLDIPLDRAPQLDRTGSKIQLLNAGMLVAKGAVVPEPRFPGRTPMGPHAGISPPTGRNRLVQRYHSVQHHLPMLYGIGEAGLSDAESVERKALAQQLKAYLMFFDQIMANQLSQLAHVKNLLSIHPAIHPAESVRTYFTQIVDEPTLQLQSIATADEAALDVMTETTSEALERKDRFLNHLLARYAEHLNDRYVASSDDAHANPALIRQKQTFLEQYPRISASRGTAYDGLGPWGKSNPSGLEDRIRFKLDLDEGAGETMTMIEHILTHPKQKHLFTWFDTHLPTNVRDKYSMRITFVFPGEKGRFKHKDEKGNHDFREVVKQTLRNQTPAHIGTYVLWLDDAAWDNFETEHKEWRKRRRENLASKLGISLGLDSRLFAVISNLSFLPGLTNPPPTSPRIADYGAIVNVDVDGSQEGNATYSLVRPSSTSAPSEDFLSAAAVIGTGHKITIESEKLVEDEVIRVQVERLFDDTIWLDAVLPVRVRANPALNVQPRESAQIAPQATMLLNLPESQASVSYQAFKRTLVDEDFSWNECAGDVRVALTAIPECTKASTVYVRPPPDKAWTCTDYITSGTQQQGNGGTLVVDAGTMEEDTLVIVQAHKNLGAIPADATDVQLKQAVLLLKRPDTAPNLTLTKTSDTTIAVTKGEPGVLYYLLDPTTNKPLGKPAYFHRKLDATVNRGIGGLRIGRDLAIAGGVVAVGANRATTKPLDPVVTVSAIPASNTVKVMAVRGRTGAAWAQAKTITIGTAAT